jgi:DNA polymerase III alpha subunit
MRKIKYTKEVLEGYVKNSLTIMDVVRKTGLQANCSNHRHIKNRLLFYNIDFSHFKGASARKGTIIGPKKHWTEILVAKPINTRTQGKKLKNALIRMGRPYICVGCKNDGKWADSNLTLQVDHINNINSDNRPENLQFMCPNCHSVKTERYRQEKRIFPQNFCKCGEKISRTTNVCRKCYFESRETYKPRIKIRKVERPPKEELEKLVWEKPFTRIGIDYNVSDNAIRKWCLYYNITNFPPRGHFIKK